MSTDQIIEDSGATEAVEAGSKKRSLDPAFKRNLTIVGGFLGVCVVLVLFVMMSAGSNAQQQAPDSALTLGTAQAVKVDSITPDMAAKVERKQLEESEEAQRRGQTYIPPDTIGTVQPVAPSHAGPSSLAMGTAPVMVQASPVSSEVDQRRREGLQRQLDALMRETPASVNVRQRIEVDMPQAPGEQPAAVAAAAAPGAATAAAAPVAASEGKEVVGGLTIHPAELTSEISVPANQQAFATARITGGPAAGAFLVGTARVVDESLEITFTQMRLNGRVYQVEARALDEATAGAAIAGNVDGRLLQRFVFPVVMAAAQGFYTAKSQTGTTVISIGGGDATGITQPAPSSEQARAAGIAAAMQIAGQEVQKSAQEPIVVSRGRGFPVGILFNAPVQEQ